MVAVVGHLDETDNVLIIRRAATRWTPPQCCTRSVITNYAKHHLPNYGVFDEYRYFKPGNELHVPHPRDRRRRRHMRGPVAGRGPVAATQEAGAGLLAVINASPYERDKDDVRGELVARRAREAGCPLAYVNLVGGQDELVFDGDTMISNADGRSPSAPCSSSSWWSRISSWPASAPVKSEIAEGTVPAEPGRSGMVISRHVVSAEASEPRAEQIVGEVATPLPAMAEVYLALEMGLRDYCRKNGIERVYLGLSGGIDSTLVATLACDAIGADRVYGISNPSAYSSEHSGQTLRNRPADRSELLHGSHRARRGRDSHPCSTSTGSPPKTCRRIRGMIWMAESNQHGPSIVLACGNKSELAVGYSTIYGDMSAASRRSRTCRRRGVEIARWRNEQAEARGETPPIENSINKEPSAELRPGQKDTDSPPCRAAR